MNYADRHAIEEANEIIRYEQSLYEMTKPSKPRKQPWHRTINDNPLLDKFVGSSVHYQFTAQVDYITYVAETNADNHNIYRPAIMFKNLVFNGVIQSKHIICPYSRNLASLNEIWHNDWIQFGAIVEKAKEPYSIYLYKLDRITKPFLVSVSERKLIRCHNPKNNNKKGNPIEPQIINYFIYSNRDYVPKNLKIRAGYAISKASVAYVNKKNNQMLFYKRLKDKNKVKYLNQYANWQTKIRRKIQKQKNLKRQRKRQQNIKAKNKAKINESTRKNKHTDSGFSKHGGRANQ